MKFICHTCGETHNAQNVSFGADAPVQWGLLSDEECANSELGGEQCIIEAKGLHHFFVRACLQIPIKGTGRAFTWGIWVSLSQNSFLEMAEHWEDSARTSLGPYFGCLCTLIPEYSDTMLLKTMVHQRGIKQRPLVELEATDHPLSIDQRSVALTPSRMQKIISNLLHAGTAKGRTND